MTSNLDDLYTIPEVSARLHIGRTAVYAEIKAGRLGCSRVGPGGHRFLVSERDVLAYLELCREPRKSKAAKVGVPLAIIAARSPVVPKKHIRI